MNFSIEHFVRLQKDIQADLPLEESLSRILRDLEKEIQYQSLGVFLKVPHTELYRLKISRNISHHFTKGTIFTAGDPLIQEMMKFEQIDIDEYGFYKLEHDFTHLIISPIFYKSELYGFIFIDRKENFFSEEHQELIKFYGSIISTTVRIHSLEDDIAQHEGFYQINHIHKFQPFIQKANSSLRLMKRYNRDISLCVLYIDNYKSLVNIHGFDLVYKIIESIGEHIKDNLRNTDIIGRYQDNIFLIVLPETDKKNALLTINPIEQNFIDIIDKNNINKGWGIAQANDETNSVMDLIKEAKHKAKESCRI
jgi:diguanylate cyclase (GGDEF)-like protein